MIDSVVSSEIPSSYFPFMAQDSNDKRFAVPEEVDKRGLFHMLSPTIENAMTMPLPPVPCANKLAPPDLTRMYRDWKNLEADESSAQVSRCFEAFLRGEPDHPSACNTDMTSIRAMHQQMSGGARRERTKDEKRPFRQQRARNNLLCTVIENYALTRQVQINAKYETEHAIEREHGIQELQLRRLKGAMLRKKARNAKLRQENRQRQKEDEQVRQMDGGVAVAGGPFYDGEEMDEDLLSVGAGADVGELGMSQQQQEEDEEEDEEEEEEEEDEEEDDEDALDVDAPFAEDATFASDSQKLRDLVEQHETLVQDRGSWHRYLWEECQEMPGAVFHVETAKQAFVRRRQILELRCAEAMQSYYKFALSQVREMFCCRSNDLPAGTVHRYNQAMQFLRSQPNRSAFASPAHRMKSGDLSAWGHWAASEATYASEILNFRESPAMWLGMTIKNYEVLLIDKQKFVFKIFGKRGCGKSYAMDQLKDTLLKGLSDREVRTPCYKAGTACATTAVVSSGGTSSRRKPPPITLGSSTSRRSSPTSRCLTRVQQRPSTARPGWKSTSRRVW